MEVWNSPWPARLIRPFATAIHRLLKAGRRRRPTFGAHALALTPEKGLVLVKLRYAPGWRLPGGGREESEELSAAVLRELREEIGMISHGAIRYAEVAGLLIVEEVRYRPHRWSLEVEAVAEFALDDLPANLSPRTLAWVDAVRGTL